MRGCSRPISAYRRHEPVPVTLPPTIPLTSSPLPLPLPSPPRGGEDEGEGIMSGVRGGKDRGDGHSHKEGTTMSMKRRGFPKTPAGGAAAFTVLRGKAWGQAKPAVVLRN